MINQAETKKNRVLSKKVKLVIYVYILLFLLIISVAATYTWFSLSRTPQVSNLSMYVTSRSGLELALTPDSEQWGSQLSFLDMANENVPLRPITWSEKNQGFYIAEYGVDGRLSGDWQSVFDGNNANNNIGEGYYTVGTFYARTNEDVKVSLIESVKTEEGISGSGTYLIGMPVWDADSLSHINAGNGAENAFRIGIEITLLDENDFSINETRQFFIYEPNCDAHIDGKAGYVETPSIDGGNTLVPSDRLILQKQSNWSEVNPVQNGVQAYTIGDFETSTELFSLKANQKAMIKLYLWLEGQDIDCTNDIQEAQVLANIQFATDFEVGSGLQPIR